MSNYSRWQYIPDGLAPLVPIWVSPSRDCSWLCLGWSQLGHRMVLKKRMRHMWLAWVMNSIKTLYSQMVITDSVHQHQSGQQMCDPCVPEFILGNIKIYIYMHFLSFLNIGVTMTVEILFCGLQESICHVLCVLPVPWPCNIGALTSAAVVFT